MTKAPRRRCGVKGQPLPDVDRALAVCVVVVAGSVLTYLVARRWLP